MPQLGESITEGTILKWMKQPGEAVALDDSLCEIETEKVTAELPSPFEGMMGEILVPEGETVEVGQPLCQISEATAGTAISVPRVAAPSDGKWSGGPMSIPPDEPPAAAAPPPVSNLAATGPRQPVIGRGPEHRERFYSPAVLRLASERGVELSAIAGTGIGGRVTRRDVEKAIAGTVSGAPPPIAPPTPAPAPAGAPGYEVVTFSATRRSIAANLLRSNREAPQAWTMVEADVTGLVALRNQERERFLTVEGVGLTLLPYFTAAVCETLRDFPALNSRWEGEELRRYHALNIGVAIAAESGLVVPVVHSAGDLSVAGLAKAIAGLVTRAQTRKLRVEDIEGGTFTVNNTGSFGSIASKPIVNHPQVGIVTMERVVKRPVVLEGDAIAVRSMVNICLSFDHRVADGIEAGGFLAALKLRLEAFAP